MFALIIIFTSAVTERSEYFSVCKDELSCSGVVIEPSSADIIMRNEDEVLDVFTEATNVTGIKSIGLNTEDYEFQSIAKIYPDDIMDIIPPRLEKGNYPKYNSDFIECLAVDGFGLNVGDVLELYDDNQEKYKVKVCGIISFNQYIYGKGVPGLYENHGDYRDLCYLFTKSSGDKPFFITTQSIAEKSKINSAFRYDSSIIVNFPENMYDSDTLEQMAYDYGFEIIGNNDSLYKGSTEYVNEQLYTLMPLSVIILILTIFTAITSSMIIIMKNQKNFAIFCLCGATWRYCSFVNIVNFIFILIISIAVDVLVFLVGKLTFLNTTVVNLSGISLIICAVIVALFLILSAVVPNFIVKNKQLKEVLKAEFRQ
ncbi:MAG: hypothetical protein LUE12_01465 [Ruminococcus sp.]|nr:hypothetical protein [Ruminococcus sp.]